MEQHKLIALMGLWKYVLVVSKPEVVYINTNGSYISVWGLWGGIKDSKI